MCISVLLWTNIAESFIVASPRYYCRSNVILLGLILVRSRFDATSSICGSAGEIYCCFIMMDAMTAQKRYVRSMYVL